MAVNQVAYGFVSLQNIFDRRITDVQVPVIETALAATLAEHNRQMDATLALFASRTTNYKERFRLPGLSRLQPIGDIGRARPVRGGSQYDIAYPMQRMGTAWGTTWLTRQKMTVADVNELVATLLLADIRYVRDYILAALFNNVDYTYLDDAYGSLTVKPLANNDSGYSYLVLNGAETGANDNHFLAQAAAIAAGTDPIPTMALELTEHPENQGGETIILVPTSNRAAVEALPAFMLIPDAAIELGADSDRLVARLGTPVPGEVFGYHRTAKAWLVEWKMLPADYLIAVSSAGIPPLALREEPESSLQGFRQVAERDDYPYYERQWIRMIGIGVRNRVGAVIQRVGNGTYAIPSVGGVSYATLLF